MNALGTYDSWAFAEFRSAYDIEADIGALVQAAIGVALAT